MKKSTKAKNGTLVLVNSKLVVYHMSRRKFNAVQIACRVVMSSGPLFSERGKTHFFYQRHV